MTLEYECRRYGIDAMMAGVLIEVLGSDRGCVTLIYELHRQRGLAGQPVGESADWPGLPIVTTIRRRWYSNYEQSRRDSGQEIE